jgi:ABC-type thiamine transport system substrate-binding protein
VKSRDKQLIVSSDIHRRLKAIAFNNDVYLQDLVAAILKNAIHNEELIRQLLSTLRRKS